MATIRVVVKGKNLDVTEALRNYAEKKVAKLEVHRRPSPSHRGSDARTERGIHIAEVTLSVAGLILRGEGKTPDMYTSIDSCVERIERQFTKYKTRIQRRLQCPTSGELAPPAQEAEEGKALAPRIVRTKRFPFKPMDVDEAIMQMELLGHDFFVFVNAATEETNVVYKRRDGNYGVIEPEF